MPYRVLKVVGKIKDIVGYFVNLYGLHEHHVGSSLLRVPLFSPGSVLRMLLPVDILETAPRQEPSSCYCLKCRNVFI